MKESFLNTISASGKGGAGQHVVIPPEVRERLGTRPGQTVRVTIDLDLMAVD